MATSEEEKRKVTVRKRNKTQENEYSRNYMKRKREEEGDEYRAQYREYMKKKRLNESEEDRQKRRDWNREYARMRRKDGKFRLFSNMKSRMNDAAKKWAIRYNKERLKTPLSILGIEKEDYIKYIEMTWKTGMTWDNYGKEGWEVDHTRALHWFDMGDEEQRKKAFHYTNTQAMWTEDNLNKGTRKLCGCSCEKCGIV